MSKPTFESSVPFQGDRVRAAAVYCSDGRFGEQVDEFLQASLGLQSYDRLAVPGGAACLAGHFAPYREEEGVVEMLRFLIQVHGLERVVLIAHDGCAYYSRRLHVTPLQVESQQHEDMGKALSRVKTLGSHLKVETYFARLRGERITFEAVR